MLVDVSTSPTARYQGVPLSLYLTAAPSHHPKDVTERRKWRTAWTSGFYEIIDDLFCFSDRAIIMKAYFDESGKHEAAEVLTIAGLLMSARTCKELQRRWLREAARVPKIPLPFHMTDCVVGRKLFEYLKDDENARAEMQMRLIGRMRGLDMHAFGTSIVRKDYVGLQDQLRTGSKYTDPWFLAFESGIQEMMHRSEKAKKKHRIDLIFDRQDEFKTRALQLYGQILDCKLPYIHRLGGLTFEDKELAALQAIDVIVYEVNRNVTDRARGSEVPRPQMISLLRSVDMGGVIWDKDHLRLLMEEKNRTAQAGSNCGT